ncbi:MAG: CPBP family intramembrane metalloprotease [Planctomycetes bacterium]|nr:CPBP family intramembrane metalloprotease [Planctomycetota bacterium]
MPKASSNSKSPLANPNGYWQKSQQPLQALFFLIPLIIFYDVGLIFFARGKDIVAHSLLKEAYEWVGATGVYLPGLIVVVMLLSMHVIRRDPWRFDVRLYGLMWLESILLAVPLFVFLLVLARQAPPANVALAGGPAPVGWEANVVFSIGAGIYEELLFRLIAIAFIHMIVVDVLALPRHVGAVAAIAISSIAFSLYHFPTWASFDTAEFFLRAVAGVYLAGVYLLRGFGVVSATHAIYDIIWVVWVVVTQTHR